MPLTSGSVSIKPTGGTYSSWAAFWDDLGNLTGDINCAVTAQAFTEGSAPAPVTENLAGNRLYVYPFAFPSTTDGSTGARFTLNYTGTCLDMQMEGPGTVIIEGIATLAGGTVPYRVFNIQNILNDFTYTLRRNIIKGMSNEGLRVVDSTLAGLEFYNNIIFDVGGRGMRFLSSGVNVGILVSNNTVVTSGTTGADGSSEAFTLENNLIYGSSTSDYSNIGSATGNNNAASDATNADGNWGSGANNVPNIADPFNAIGSDDFTITAEGVIGTAGKDLSGSFTTDFFGVTRSNWTIGAVEFISPPTTPQAVGGTLTPTGTLAKVATFPRTYGGSLTPTGALARILTAYKALSGGMTPSGALAAAIIMEQALGGELDLSGILRGINPAWLVLDDILMWQGEWSITWSYDLNDVVLYKFGDEWHVFVSKISHNVGNIPTSTAEAWHRLYQEQYL